MYPPVLWVKIHSTIGAYRLGSTIVLLIRYYTPTQGIVSIQDISSILVSQSSKMHTFMLTVLYCKGYSINSTYMVGTLFDNTLED